ncbi:MAG TPA: hypothetical protein VLI92_04555 [Candidatus Saccharimonadales bacterium]|nr:hypothetical protein [Candidatus Saccharimonadales bacterium]
MIVNPAVTNTSEQNPANTAEQPTSPEQLKPEAISSLAPETSVQDQAVSSIVQETAPGQVVNTTKDQQPSKHTQIQGGNKESEHGDLKEEDFIDRVEAAQNEPTH